MQNLELERKYRRSANRLVLFCTTVFCSFRIILALLDGELHTAGIIAVVTAMCVGGYFFFKNKRFRNAPFIVPFIIYLVYVGTAFVINSFTYFYGFYFLIISASAIYFNSKNFLTLIITTQIINLILSMTVLSDYIAGNPLANFATMFGVSIIIYFLILVSIEKLNTVSNAFASFGALMKVTPNVLILVDSDNKIKYLSQSVSKVLGIEDFNSFIGKDFLELFNEKSVRDLLGEIAHRRAFYEEYQKISINGVAKTFDISADKMSDKGDDGMFFMFNDVSEIIRLKELAEQDSLMDSLIQIPNRRAFDRQISEEWSRSLRDEVNVSFMMIDIDFFKKYNDTYGHRQGDELLKVAGEVFKRSLKRSTDFVARLGGEEFGVVLHATNAYQAGITAERIRKAVEETVILTTSGKRTGFTVSIGVCTLIPSKGLEYSHLIEEADKALYKAKHNGRNRVCISEL